MRKAQGSGKLKSLQMDRQKISTKGQTKNIHRGSDKKLKGAGKKKKSLYRGTDKQCLQNDRWMDIIISRLHKTAKLCKYINARH